jgi:hypothetical protein
LGREDDEIRHEVTLTQDFYMQTTEVTQEQWQAVMGQNPSYFPNCGPNCPVDSVSWDDVQVFIERLNAQRADGYKYRLPTEAEWEYAARAGSNTAFCEGDITEPEGNDPILNTLGWYGENSDASYEGCREQDDGGCTGTQPVGGKNPNAWGLFDMHGNLSEWCSDWYGDYPANSITDPQGPSSGNSRVLRSGGWYLEPWHCRSANRRWDEPGSRGNGGGFRLAVDYGEDLDLFDNLVSYYKFDETSEDAIDSYGDNDGIVSNVVQNVPGIIGGAYDFSRDNDAEVKIPGNYISSADELTVSAWVNVPYSADGQFIFIDRGEPNTYIKAQMYIMPDGNLLCHEWDGPIGGASGLPTSGEDLDDEEWHFVACVFDYSNDTIRVYVDGDLSTIESMDGSYSSGSSVYTIGNNWNEIADTKGYIDEVGIWNRTLSDEEVNELYNNGNGLTYNAN